MRPKTIVSAEKIHRGVLFDLSAEVWEDDGGNPSLSVDLPLVVSWSPAEAVIGTNDVASRLQMK
jgi:hypothetical protein